MSEQQDNAAYDLETIKSRLTALRDEVFDIANAFAIGDKGLPKNGAAAVCCHEVNNQLGEALRALEDPTFSQQLSNFQHREHQIRTLLEISGIRPTL